MVVSIAMGRSQVLYNRKKGRGGRGIPGRGQTKSNSGHGGPESIARGRDDETVTSSKVISTSRKEIAGKMHNPSPLSTAKETRMEAALVSIPTANFAEQSVKEETHLPSLSLNTHAINTVISKASLSQIYRIPSYLSDVMYGEIKESEILPTPSQPVALCPTDESDRLDAVVFSRSESTQRSTTESHDDVAIPQSSGSWPDGQIQESQDEEGLDAWLDSVIS